MVKSKKPKNEEKIKLKPKEKIIKSLIENKNPQSIRTISGSAVIDYKNTYNYIGDLTTSGAIVQNAIGNTNLIRLNISPNQEIYNVENKRAEEFFLKNPKLKLIKKDIEEIGYPFMIVLVFGSYTKGAKTENSDIDICIISDNDDKIKKLINKLNLLSLKLEIHQFTANEFISMIEKNQNNLGREIIKNNLIFYGIENYYNLISKWMKKE